MFYGKEFYLDICAALLQLVLIISLYFRKMMNGRKNRLFIFLLADLFVATISNVFENLIGIVFVLNENTQIIRLVLQYIYFISRNFTIPIYILFIYEFVGLWPRFKSNLINQIIWIFPFIIDCFIIGLNFFNDKLFYYDEYFNYFRGPNIYILYVCAAIYYIYGLILVIANYKNIPVQKFWVLITFYPINLTSVLIEFFNKNMLIENITTTLCFFVASILIQRPEDCVNPQIGTFNYKSFIQDMKVTFYQKNRVKIIFVKMVNYGKARKVLGWDNCEELLTFIARKFYEICITSNVYYIESGAFAIVDENIENDYETVLRAEQMMEVLNEICDKYENKLKLEFCNCILDCPKDINDYESFLSFASTFDIKIKDRNKVVEISKIQNSKNFQLMNQIDDIIINAIKNNDFKMYYQPIYSAKDKKFTSAEALIRLENDKFGYISPEQFIPAAEASGAIHHIGNLVVENVFKFISECNFEELGLKYIEFNLSYLQCIESDIVQRIVFLMDKYHVSAEQINLEITETASGMNNEIFARNINTFVRLGIPISLDDFGTGYSNIKKLVSFPFELVKIDKSFTDFEDNEKLKEVSKITVEMLKKMDKKILIEGIENQESYDYFEELGCDYFQGFHFSKALSQKDFIQFLKEKNR